MSGRELVFEVDGTTFEEKVVAASADRVVVVDFWAEWCAPCRMIGPVLEKTVLSYGGKALLAKVDVQSNQDLASRWGIQSIPAVKIFRDGKVAAEFIGALPESEVRRRLDEIIPSEADELVVEGKRLAAEGTMESAEVHYRTVLESSPTHPGASVELAAILVDRKEYVEARQLAETASADTAEYDQAQGILARIHFAVFCAEKGGLAACEKCMEENSEDVECRFARACCLAAEQRYEAALDEFLHIVQADRKAKGDAVKEEMVRVFSIIGQHSDQAKEYRSKLTRVLYC